MGSAALREARRPYKGQGSTTSPRLIFTIRFCVTRSAQDASADADGKSAGLLHDARDISLTLEAYLPQLLVFAAFMDNV